MYTYLSDFKLPKEFSKKKKLQLTVAEVVPKKGDQNYGEWSWKLNTDLTRVYMTIEEAVKGAIIRATHDKRFSSPKDITDGAIAVLTLEFPVNIFNDFPVASKANGDVIDADFDPDTLSFNVTLQGRFAENSHLDILAIDEFKLDVEHDKVVSMKLHPIVNSAAPAMAGETTPINL